ncbi:hypothetical protein EVAR_78323_1 [Eumeta japonica]|uniref:Uncharacterized protein n=1 Tax=Eumeta variegata TaxID=151549 RepID=A0A4C1T654_EUMVA|nr:hypothetical protein EVAR_78323_1 [Eumeta japonica]
MKGGRIVIVETHIKSRSCRAPLVYECVWCRARQSRNDSYATFALVPVIYSGYRAVCTPSPRTVVLAIFASSRGKPSPMTLLRRGNPEEFMTFTPLALPVPSGHLDEAITAYGLKGQAP